MKEAELKQHLAKLAQEAFPDSLDPWPTLKGRLPVSDRKTDLRGFSMKTETTRIKTFHPATRVAAILCLALLLAGAIFLITPQGRTLAQSILHFFNHTESNFMPGSTATPLKWVEQTPGMPAPTFTPLTRPGPAFETACGTYSSPKCSIEEIRVKVSYSVFGLSPIPDGLYFTGATGSPDRVHLVYQTKDQSATLTVDEEPWTGSPGQKAWEVGASADIQTVTVGSVTAEYVKGSYNGSRNPPEWDPNLGVQSLRWVDHGILFTMMLTSGSVPPMDKNSLSALIGRLTDGPLTAVTPIPAEKPTVDPIAEIQKSVDYVKGRYSLSVEQAEQQSGIKIHLPTHLPDVLTFQGARYEPEQKWVIVFYLFDQTQWGPNTDGLSVVEQPVPQNGDCPLCSAFITGKGDRKDVPQNVVGGGIKTVEIGNITGQYVEGVWSSWEDGYGWHWDADPYLKRLRWQANGMAYELSYMGMEITQEDMTAIAKSMK